MHTVQLGTSSFTSTFLYLPMFNKIFISCGLNDCIKAPNHIGLCDWILEVRSVM